MIVPEPTSMPPSEGGGLLARAGQQVANMPSDLINDMLRVSYGIVGDPQEQPVQVPKPYQIGEAKTLGEGVVDVGAGLARSLPLFLGGETAGEGLAEALGAGKIAASALRVGGGFAASELPNSPERAGIGAATGGVMGAAAELPLRARIPIALGVGAATGAEAYHEGASGTSALIQGGTNALLAMMGKRAAEPDSPAIGDATLQLPAANRLALEDVQTARPIPGTGGPIPFGGVLDESTTRARPIFGTEQSMMPAEPVTYDAETGQRVLTGPPNPLALPKRSVPPPGSLVRDAIMTPDELRRALNPNARAPEGSLVRNPSITQEELDRFLNRKSSAPPPARETVQPVVEPDGGTRTRPNSIVGPALVDADGNVIAKGVAGVDNHASIMQRGVVNDPANADKLIDAFSDDSKHVFLDAHGNQLSREAAAQVAREAGQVGGDVSVLHSEHLRASQEGEGGISSIPTESLTVGKEVATSQPPAPIIPFPEQPAPPHLQKFHEDLQKRIADRIAATPRTTLEAGTTLYSPSGREYKFRTDLVPDKSGRQRIMIETPDGEQKMSAYLDQFSVRPPGSEIEGRTPIVEGRATAPEGSLVRYPAVTDEELRRAGLVATLQPPDPKRKDLLRLLWAAQEDVSDSAASHPSSLETGTGEKTPLFKTTVKDENGKPYQVTGNVVKTDGSIATIRDAVTGEEHDVWNHKLEPADAKDLPSAEQEGGGFGGWLGKDKEGGFVDRDFMRFMAHYGTPSIAGALAGAVWDHDHPIRGAILGAVAGGMIGRFGWAAYDMLLEAHPELRKAAGISDIPVKLGKAAVKDTISAARAAFADDYMAGRAAQDFRDDVGLNRIARFMQQNFKLTDLMRRLTTQAAASVDILADELHQSARAIAKHPDLKVPVNEDAFLKFMEGKIDVATLQRTITDRALSNSIMAAKNQLDSLESIIGRGLGDSALGKTILDNVGKYMTRAYKVFHDPKYNPTDAQIEAAAKSMPELLGGGSLENNMQILNDYLHEIKSAQGMYRGGATKMAARLDSVLARPENITDEFRQMLGEYNSPLERLAATALKVTRTARVSALYNAMAEAINPVTGLKYVMSGEELATERARLQGVISTASGVAKDKAVATLQQLDKMTNIPREAAMGRLSGMWAPVSFRDQLATWDSLDRSFTSPQARLMAQMTNNIKKYKTVYSPFQFTRQVLNFPLLALMAKAGPGDMARAIDVVFNQKSAKYAAEVLKLKQLGIWGGDIVHGQFREDMARLMKEGSLDNYLYSSPVKDFQHWWEEKYRTPDLAVRVAAFYKGQKLGQALGLTGKALEDYAVDHTNRYTVNYQAVPAGLQKARQFPFVNQYVTFLWEVSRITKNLGEDALMRRDPHAMAILGTMAASPFILQHLSEQSLSEDDRKDWELAKSLGPEYQRSNFKFVHGRNADGTFSYTDFTPLLIHDTWLKTARSFFSGDWSALQADQPIFGWENTPLLNVAINQATGTDRHSGIKFEGLSDRLDSMRKDIGPTLIGTELDNFVKATTPNADGTIGLTNQRSGASSSLWGMLKSYVTATRDYNVKLDYLKQRQVSTAHEGILNERARLMQTMRTNAADDVKQVAVARYQSNVKGIVATLQQSINPPDSMAALSGTQSSQ